MDYPLHSDENVVNISTLLPGTSVRIKPLFSQLAELFPLLTRPILSSLQNLLFRQCHHNASSLSPNPKLLPTSSFSLCGGERQGKSPGWQAVQTHD
jgi:hypothetical protein